MEDWFDAHDSIFLAVFAIAGAVHGLWAGILDPCPYYSPVSRMFGEAFGLTFGGVIGCTCIFQFLDWIKEKITGT